MVDFFSNWETILNHCIYLVSLLIKLCRVSIRLALCSGSKDQSKQEQMVTATSYIFWRQMLFNWLKQKFIESTLCVKHCSSSGEIAMNKRDKTLSLNEHLQFSDRSKHRINKWNKQHVDGVEFCGKSKQGKIRKLGMFSFCTGNPGKTLQRRKYVGKE